MSNITDSLEEKCRAIVHDMEKRESEPSPMTFITREMALHLDHIDKIRQRQKEMKADLLKRELEIGTQILNAEERVDLMPNMMERMEFVNELKQMRDKITTQSQRLTIESEMLVQKLQTRLLQLWNMHDQL